MPAFTFHLIHDGIADRAQVVPGDDIMMIVDDARQTVAQIGSEAMRSLSRSPSWGGTWTVEAMNSAGKTVCELSIVAK